MAEASPEQLDAWLDDGIHLFNDERFWHAHESWEDAWRACPTAERDFFQGLILCAAALFKLDQTGGRPHALRRLTRKATDRLEPYPRDFYGLDIHILLDAMSRVALEAGRYLEDEDGWQERFNRDLVPSLERQPSGP